MKQSRIVAAAAFIVILSVVLIYFSKDRGSETVMGMMTQEDTGITLRIDMPEIEEFMAMSKEGPIVPALLQDAIPQGITYLEEKDWLVISYYRENKEPSLLGVVEAKTGDFVKAVYLYETESTPYIGHAGGVTASKSHLWIASGGNANWIETKELIDAENDSAIVFGGAIRTDTRASFTTYSDGVLWIGEYALGSDYPTEQSHYMKNRENKEHKAWAAGYKLDEDSDLLPESKGVNAAGQAAPDYVLSLPDTVQGMHIASGLAWISQSYGSSKPSTLSGYQVSLAEEPHATAVFGDQTVPVWFLDNQNKAESYTIPPMSEGIVEYGDKMYILFESGATKFRRASSYALDRILVWDK